MIVDGEDLVGHVAQQEVAAINQTSHFVFFVHSVVFVVVCIVCKNYLISYDYFNSFNSVENLLDAELLADELFVLEGASAGRLDRLALVARFWKGELCLQVVERRLDVLGLEFDEVERRHALLVLVYRVDKLGVVLFVRSTKPMKTRCKCKYNTSTL